MNTQSANVLPINDISRCQHRTPSGRRCKLPVSSPGAPLCYTHQQALQKQEANDLSPALLSNTQGFQTAQGVNYALRDLYKLLAANRISPRRASVLAFINSLILRTLPAIDADQAAGIEDPTAPGDDDDSESVHDSPPPEPLRIERPTDAVLPLSDDDLDQHEEKRIAQPSPENDPTAPHVLVCPPGS